MNSSNISRILSIAWRIGIGKTLVIESESLLSSGFQNSLEQKKGGYRLNLVNESASCLCKRGKFNCDGSTDMVSVSDDEIGLEN